MQLSAKYELAYYSFLQTVNGLLSNSNAKVMGSNPKVLIDQMYFIPSMKFNSLGIEASAKCIKVNVSKICSWINILD